MKGLNISKMKKVADDGKSATFKHQDGHTIKIAVSALTPQMKKQLSELPLHAAEGTPSLLASNDQYANNSDNQNALDDLVGAAIKKYQASQGLSAAPQKTVSAPQNQSDQQSPSSSPLAESSASLDQDVNDFSDELNKPDDTVVPTGPEPGSGAPSDQLPAQPSGDLQKPQINADSPINVDGAQPVKLGSMLDTMPWAAPEQQVAPGDKYLQDVADWKDALAKGTVKPETFNDLFVNKDTPGKIGTLFSLLASGFGSGLSHQPNMVMQMMQKEIDNDFERQKVTTANAHNFLQLNYQHELQKIQEQLIGGQIGKTAAETANLPLTGALTEAETGKTQAQTGLTQAETGAVAKRGVLTDAQTIASLQESGLTQQQANEVVQRTRALSFATGKSMANWGLLKKQMDLVQKLPEGSLQRKQLEQSIPLLFQSINNNDYDIASRLTAAGTLGNLVNPQNGAPQPGGLDAIAALKAAGYGDLANDKMARTVPGIPGTAKEPVDKSDRDQLRAMMLFDRTVKGVRKWAADRTSPWEQMNVADKNYGITQLRNLQTQYRDLQGMGALKGFDIPLLDQEIGTNPVSMFNSVVNDPKLKAAQDANAARFKNYKDSLYGPQSQAAPTKSQNQPTAGSQPAQIPEGATGTYQGKSVIRKGGKWVPR